METLATFVICVVAGGVMGFSCRMIGMESGRLTGRRWVEEAVTWALILPLALVLLFA